MRASAKLLAIIGCLLFFLGHGALAQARPYHSSSNVCLLDADSGQIIYSQKAGEIRPVASTTKIMTAILSVEYAELDDRVEVSSRADHTPEYTIGLKEGQKLPVSELLKAALVKSSNDAAVALAEHVAGNERLFSHLMSKKAFIIGAVNTHFINASGLPADEHWSTAYDLAVMGRYLLQKKYIKDLVASRQVEFKHPAYQQEITLTNTNSLLQSYNGANGIKTGTTNAAGKCLVASAKRDSRQLIAVALNSHDRNGDCSRLLNYGYGEVSLERIIDKNIPFKELKISQGLSDYVEIYPEKDLLIWSGREERLVQVEKIVEMDYSISAPVKANQVLGVLHVYVDDELFASIKLISRKDIEKSQRWLIKLKEMLY
ncbi:MAG: D-alanyl-D-alanine carboxypeptidase [Syntrophomonadaceae bacterium]|nr:D-alanyl-D-alanine carboxypeptidase [Syntrophomonadaceae bacterium]